MTTIYWKTPAPHGTCRSRYKARRAAAVAERQREKKLMRKISALLYQQPEETLSQRMRHTFIKAHGCLQCGLPYKGGDGCCSFCDHPTPKS